MAILLDYEGIEGETSDKNNEGCIDCEGWRFKTDRSVTSNTSTKGDRESSNATISDLEITKYMDSSSLRLFIESLCGIGKEVRLILTKTGKGDGSDLYMEYILKNAIISGYEVGGTADDINRPTENITISFVEIEARYTPYDEDGNAIAASSVGFDTATNTKK